MLLMLVEINLLAVVIAAVISMVLGALWYSPTLFGNLWMKEAHLSHEMVEKAKKGGMVHVYILNFVGLLVTAYVLAHFIRLMGGSGWRAGATAGFWVWLGFIAPLLMGAVLWEGRTWKLWLLNNGYWLLSLLLMGSILATM